MLYFIMWLLGGFCGVFIMCIMQVGNRPEPKQDEWKEL